MIITVLSYHDVSYFYRMILWHGMACSFLHRWHLLPWITLPTPLLPRSEPCARWLALRLICAAWRSVARPIERDACVYCDQIASFCRRLGAVSGRRSLAVTVSDPAGVRQLRLSRCCHWAWASALARPTWRASLVRSDRVTPRKTATLSCCH
jgi:hypothetical protein